MNKKLNALLISFSVAALLATSAASAGRHQYKHKNFHQVSTNTVEQVSISTDSSDSDIVTQLTGEEIESLLFMREEEKVARDVYLTLFEQWSHPVFANIAKSEQKHMDAMAKLLEQYQLDDPMVDDSIGSFVNMELAEMYVDLVEKGQQSLMDALHVGALIEEVDIEDIQEGIEHTDEEMIIYVYENLLKGSRNHLRAFVGTIENMGATYEPQVLEAEEVFEIVDSPMERG